MLSPTAPGLVVNRPASIQPPCGDEAPEARRTGSRESQAARDFKTRWAAEMELLQEVSLLESTTVDPPGVGLIARVVTYFVQRRLRHVDGALRSLFAGPGVAAQFLRELDEFAPGAHATNPLVLQMRELVDQGVVSAQSPHEESAISAWLRERTRSLWDASAPGVTYVIVKLMGKSSADAADGCAPAVPHPEATADPEPLGGLLWCSRPHWAPGSDNPPAAALAAVQAGSLFGHPTWAVSIALDAGEPVVLVGLGGDGEPLQSLHDLPIPAHIGALGLGSPKAEASEAHQLASQDSRVARQRACH